MCLKVRQEDDSDDFLLCFVLVGVRGFEPLPSVRYRSLEFMASVIRAHCSRKSWKILSVLSASLYD
jgi:hypothetical protein